MSRIFFLQVKLILGSNMIKKILVTGSAGFIGFHLSELLLKNEFVVIGVDCITDYYDQNLKLDRLKILLNYERFFDERLDITNFEELSEIFARHLPNYVIHLAAQAGVRYSIQNPRIYLNSNIIGTFNVIESAKKFKVKHLIIGSSSSVYGANKKFPFQEIDKTDNQVSFYASTKKSTESLAHSYASLWRLPITVLRFFTVYGPWGRPDMAYYKFAYKIFNNEKIDVFNYGKHKRDFTYIDDVTSFIKLVCKNSLIKSKEAHIFNVGNSNPIKLTYLIELIESYLGKKAQIRLQKKQIGDVDITYANMKNVEKKMQFKTKVSIEDGMKHFIDWFLDYHR